MDAKTYETITEIATRIENAITRLTDIMVYTEKKPRRIAESLQEDLKGLLEEEVPFIFDKLKGES